MSAVRLPVGLSLVLVSLLAAGPAAQDTAQRQPTFRSRVTLVPIDVRVLDERGRPVTDLRRDDFTIVEDGEPQAILHFSFNALTPGAPVSGPPELRRSLDEPLAPPTRRTFLILLGRGRQVGPGRNVRAAIEFLHERLLPQDQVAIHAWNRTTPFTTDHEAAARTLQSYWERHELIEAKLEHHFHGLAMAYADPEIPPRIQRLVDEVFEQPGVLRARHVPPGDITDRSSYDEEIARNAGPALADADAIMSSLQRNSPTMRDLENLFAGITYMRYLEGEKHLVFLTPQGLQLPRKENSETIARLASDARVALDVVHTHGMIGPPPSTARLSFNLPTAGMIFNMRWQVENSRLMSELTGGETAAFKYGDQTFARLDESTRAHYLLGYAPTNGNWDGRYRKVRVTVNRPGARVLSRQGYYGRQFEAPVDRRQFMTYTRITSALQYHLPIRDIRVTLDSPVHADDTVTASARIEPGSLTFRPEGESYVASLEAFFSAGDERDRMVGDVSKHLDFRLSHEEHDRYLREGITLAVRIPVRAAPRRVKIVLYDVEMDVIGSATADVSGR
jgi:VWFA-related protein